MALIKELLKILEQKEEPIAKRIQIADSAYKSMELPLQHREAILLKWIIKNSDYNSKDMWDLFNNWLKSDQFRALNRNDIGNDEIKDILHLLMEKMALLKETNISLTKKILDSLIILLQNRIFQQYFKYNMTLYCQLLSCSLEHIHCPIYLEEYLRNNFFFKNLVEEEEFHKHFLSICFPVVVKSLTKFKNDKLFEIVSKIVQKCIFCRNRKSFGIFVDQFFEDGEIEKQAVPKALFECLLNSYDLDKEIVNMQYKLVLHALYNAYQTDFDIVYKFFLLLVHIIGFSLNGKLQLYQVSKLKISCTLKKSEEIFLELLNVFQDDNNNNFELKVKGISFNELLQTILRQLISFNAPSDISYKIIIKAISVNPLIVLPIIDDIFMYTMKSDNTKHKEEYERLIIYIFEIYSKLQRVEYLVAKMVALLYDTFIEEKTTLEIINCEFNGIKDVEVSIMQKDNFKADDILTDKILHYFSKCICSLASWQVINIFKTFLFHLGRVLGLLDKIHYDNTMCYTYVGILSNLTGILLSSFRIAEHTVTTQFFEKSLKCLDELRNLQQQFGSSLLNREHSNILMRSFLNISYHWGEAYMTLASYSGNNELGLCKSIDNDFTSCNITFLHPYLSIKQWCLISERITNFGESPCKKLQRKLFIQKLRAILLFEKTVSDEIILNIINSITTPLENVLLDNLQDKYVVNNLLYKMDKSLVILLAESLVNNIKNFSNFHQEHHILYSPLLLSAINFVAITKINKLVRKSKRKLDEGFIHKLLSSRIYSTFTEELFLFDGNYKEVIDQAKTIYNSNNNEETLEIKIDEEKIIACLEILQKFPILFSADRQKIYLLYLTSLHRDLSFQFKSGLYNKSQAGIETIITGLLQQCKFRLIDLFEIEVFCKDVVYNYKEWAQVFSYTTDNVFRYKNSIPAYESLVLYISKNLMNPIFMTCSVIILNTAIKVRKMKMPKEIKTLTEKYRNIFCNEVLQLVSENNIHHCLISGYVYALQTFISHSEEEKLSKLLNFLDSYIDFALQEKDKYHNISYLILFITVLQNKSKIKSIREDLELNIWNACKENECIYDRFEEYSQLVVLIFEHIPNEIFATITTDLFNITVKSIKEKKIKLFGKHLQTWESILLCSFNSFKIKILQGELENLLQKLTELLQNFFANDHLCKDVKLIKTLIQTNQLLLTSPLIDMLILSASLLLFQRNQDFLSMCGLSISILESLIKYRSSLIMDRLPSYLQQYRIILRSLTKQSKTDLHLDDSEVKQLSDCAHQFEKLTKNFITYHKDMARIAMYLVADILEQYEQGTIYPSVRIHLNNCVYTLISLCDQHAVSYLIRVLSSGSIELFKFMYENYKKYYRFTGKV